VERARGTKARRAKAYARARDCPQRMPVTFQARCEKCGAVREFEEYTRERRRMTSSRGDFQFDREYSFRCRTCGERADKLVDVQGQLHKWSGNKHVTFKPG
jgi:hypothetical protein